MDINKISVEDSSIGGKFVGNNDNSNTFNNFYQSSNYLEELYNKFQEEKLNNPDLAEFCEELDYYNSKIEGDVLGLEEKLTQGNRERMIFFPIDHQIIFTFSMVSDELNDTDYCVGKYYNISNKTLEI